MLCPLGRVWFGSSYQGDDGVIQFNFGALGVAGSGEYKEHNAGMLVSVIWTEW
jgi:hypothetical protein